MRDFKITIFGITKVSLDVRIVKSTFLFLPQFESVLFQHIRRDKKGGKLSS